MKATMAEPDDRERLERKESICLHFYGNRQPKSSVMRFASVFCAVSEREFVTPHSRMRFPNIRKPTRATDFGATMSAMIVTRIGKSILTALLTCFAAERHLYFPFFLVVRSFMTGG